MRVATLTALGALAACGAPQGTEAPRGRAVSGQITYDARHPTPQGASEAVEARPARHVDLQVLDAAGAVLVEGRADATGRFALEVPSEARRLRVLARVRVRGHDVAISQDAHGRRTHAVEVALPESGPLALHAVDETGDAGAFHVVDTLLRGLDAVQRWTGETLPPLFAYWVRGGTREWSFYRGERPEGSGRFALELLGGDPGQASITDTDEHDEVIVLHELGHFVMDRLAGNSSTGGMHPRGARIDPGVAWEEGRSSWFAVSVLGAPLYRDTIGVQPWGRLRVDEDLESAPDAVAGLASETSVSKVLWDLTDGVEGYPDVDGDGLALGPGAVLEAMAAHADEPGRFTSLPSFLRSLVHRGRVDEEALRGMLERTGEPHAQLLPASDAPLPWPRELALGAPVDDRIDGLTQPAPGGGPNLPVTGFDANHTYRVRVERPGMLVARLRLGASGRREDRADLDLELRDLRAELLAASRTQGPEETLARMVEPGWFILKVRDAGQGNRADYRLEVVVETL